MLLSALKCPASTADHHHHQMSKSVKFCQQVEVYNVPQQCDGRMGTWVQDALREKREHSRSLEKSAAPELKERRSSIDDDAPEDVESSCDSLNEAGLVKGHEADSLNGSDSDDGGIVTFRECGLDCTCEACQG